MDVTELAQELRELRQRLDDWPIPPKENEGSFPSVKIEKDPAKSNYKLKPGKFPSYNGDRSTYAAWRRAVLSTLKKDWNNFDYDNSYVFLMIYNALEGKAQKQSASYFESGGRDGREDPEEFIAFLDRSNLDPNRINRARGELNSMRMGKHQQWNSFFAQWANKLTESDGDRWPDDVKISQLRGKLNMTLRRAIANNHLLPNNDYFQWLRIVGQIAQQNDELARDCDKLEYSDIRNQVNNKVNARKFVEEGLDNINTEHSRSGTERGFVGNLDSTGDTFMGGVNMARVLKGPNGKPLRAKWKSPEQIRKLRDEKKCYRCERKGCSTKVCRLLPARNPKREGPEVNVNEFLNLDPNLYEEDNDEAPASESVSEN